MKKAKAILLSVIGMAVVSTVLLALAALIFGKMKMLPKGIIPIVTTVISCVGVFIGSFLASVYAREKGLLLGLLSGGIFAFCIALISVLLFQNDFNLASAGKLAAILLSGSIGGILGVNRKDKVKF